MAFSNLLVKALYNGNGVTTNFPIPATLMVDDSAETMVYIRDTLDPDHITNTLQVEGALQDYTLTGASPPTTPFDTTVTFNTAPRATDKVLVIRVLPKTQILDMANSGATPLESIELALDRVVAMIQELGEQADRSPRYPVTSNEVQPILPEPVANNLLGFDETGTNLDVFTMDDLADALDTGDLLTTHTTTVGNNIISPDDVYAMVFDSAVYKTIIIDYSIKRRTTLNSYCGTGRLILEYDELTSAWLTPTDVNYTNGHGITFSITALGQVQYASDNMAGANYLSKLTWRIARRFEADT